MQRKVNVQCIFVVMHGTMPMHAKKFDLVLLRKSSALEKLGRGYYLNKGSARNIEALFVFSSAKYLQTAATTTISFQ